MNQTQPKPKPTKKQRAALRKAFDAWLETAEADDVFTPSPELVAKLQGTPKPPLDRLPQATAQAIRELSTALDEKGSDKRAAESPVRVIHEAIAQISITRTKLVARQAEADRLRELNEGLVQHGARLARDIEEVTGELARAQGVIRALRRGAIPEA